MLPFEERGFLAASSFLRSHSPLVSGLRFAGIFGFSLHWPKLASYSQCIGSDLIGQVWGVPSLLHGIV